VAQIYFTAVDKIY